MVDVALFDPVYRVVIDIAQLPFERVSRLVASDLNVAAPFSSRILRSASARMLTTCLRRVGSVMGFWDMLGLLGELFPRSQSLGRARRGHRRLSCLNQVVNSVLSGQCLGNHDIISGQRLEMLWKRNGFCFAYGLLNRARKKKRGGDAPRKVEAEYTRDNACSARYGYWCCRVVGCFCWA